MLYTHSTRQSWAISHLSLGKARQKQGGKQGRAIHTVPGLAWWDSAYCFRKSKQNINLLVNFIKSTLIFVQGVATLMY